ncbi:branched-chain amino acid ABC transporter permease [Roseococcus sp. SDR]|uniref:branched-chain amino acid ABC transporter permease n=1 Tax=Roseococcus sp. SDR TaxID=2835532 RepID=UPI001BCC2855|nr:branched-chain amino acid ABC transporter permease [Roseococcus sp. SDR]MBS7791653.1 branched-chain amino acid ABC transporter permease [Roseococcus sp. SDR]MBV1846967.1 branched-chain amino acid ABC transporter permease [Roseococcus sp. SDR]
MIAQQLVNGLMLGGIYVLVAVSFTLFFGCLNFLNFSVPALFMLGGFLTWAGVAAGLSWPLAVLLALTVAALASLLVERLTWRLQRGGPPLIPLVSSLGFLILFENLVLVRWGSDARAIPSPFGDANWRIGDVVIGLPQLFGLILSISLVFGLQALLKRTKLGRGIRSLAENAETATMLGVEVDRVAPRLFLLAGLFCALAGVLFSLSYQLVSPYMGDQVALKGLSAMVLGGMGNIWGAVIGGLVIGLVEIFAVGALSADHVNVVVFGILLLSLIIKPTGLFGDPALGQQKL